MQNAAAANPHLGVNIFLKKKKNKKNTTSSQAFAESPRKMIHIFDS
jgi:hypothetical protein